LTAGPHGKTLESLATVVVTNRSPHPQRLQLVIIWLANPDGSYWLGIGDPNASCASFDLPDFDSGAIGSPGGEVVQAGRSTTPPCGLMLCPEPGCGCSATWRAGSGRSTPAEIEETRRLVAGQLLRDGVPLPGCLRNHG
jgi:hypothetical protein